MKNIPEMQTKLLFLIFITLTAACTKKTLGPISYMQYIEDQNNGLKVIKSIGDYEFIWQYKPLDYVVLMETKDPNTTEDFRKKRIKELDNLQYYTLKIKSEKDKELLAAGITDEREYYHRLEYFMGEMQNDLALIQDGDTISCALFHYERVYSAGPYATFVIGFPSVHIQQGLNLHLLYNDRVLGIGPVMAQIKAADIQSVPQLILKN